MNFVENLWPHSLAWATVLRIGYEVEQAGGAVK
jgi:hypothetical protein